MGFFRFKKKATEKVRQGSKKGDRVQLNACVERGIKTTVSLLAHVYEVPIYTIIEHCVDIAGSYMMLVRDDKK